MPRTSVYIIRASLLALIAGGLIGLASLGASMMSLSTLFHADVMLLGFMLPFAFGTAAWILPKRGGVRDVTIPAVVYFAGLLTLLSYHFIPFSASEIAGRSIVVAGAVLFVGALMPRVKHIAAVRRHDHSTHENRR